jgi:AcrR family transcriptional regulator
LRQLGIDTDLELLRDRLLVTSWDDTYLAGGVFDPRAMLALLRSWWGDRERQSTMITRILADMAWTLQRPPGGERLGEYESALDDDLRRAPSVTVCCYDLERHSAATIAEVLRAHPLTLTQGSLRRSSAPDSPISPRDRIMSAASELFWASGVSATGVDPLIRAAGVAKATFYRHFPSKDDLVVAWLEDPQTRWFDRVRLRVESSGAQPIEQIPLVFEIVAGWLEDGDYRGCPYLNTAVELPDPAHPARAVIRRYIEEIEAYFGTLVEAAGLVHPAMVAAELLALLAGAISLAVARRTSAFALSAREAAVQILTVAERREPLSDLALSD